MPPCSDSVPTSISFILYYVPSINGNMIQGSWAQGQNNNLSYVLVTAELVHDLIGCVKLIIQVNQVLPGLNWCKERSKKL